MGLFQAFNISASGMTAERFRTDIIAQNIANVTPQLRRLQQRHMYQVCSIKMMPRQPTPEESSL